MLEIFRIFIKFGTFGFGGPIATIAMMEEETVSRRKWIDSSTFTQTYSILKVFPGAISTQMAIYLGRARGGVAGGFLAGVSFVFPSFLLILLMAIFYQNLKSLSQIETLFSGMQVAALAIIFQSALNLSQPYYKSVRAGLIAVISGSAIFFVPRAEPLLILAFGILGIINAGPPSKFILAGFWGWGAKGAGALSHNALGSLILVCLKAGFLVFGTGLAIVPLLEADVVGHYHWLTHGEFLDALAAGQVTPGPVVITATFIGYRVAGFFGAIAATLSIFASAFVNVLVILPFIEKKVAGSPKLKGFTDWAFPAVIGGILATSLKLSMNTVTNFSLGILLVVTLVIVFWKKPAAWLVIPCAGMFYFLAKLAI